MPTLVPVGTFPLMCSWYPGEERFQVDSIAKSRGLYGLFSLAHSLKHPNYFRGQKQIHAHIQIVHWYQTAHERDHEIKGQKCVKWVQWHSVASLGQDHIFLLSLGNLLPRDKGLWERIDGSIGQVINKFYCIFSNPSHSLHSLVPT